MELFPRNMSCLGWIWLSQSLSRKIREPRSILSHIILLDSRWLRASDQIFSNWTTFPFKIFSRKPRYCSLPGATGWPKHIHYLWLCFAVLRKFFYVPCNVCLRPHNRSGDFKLVRICPGVEMTQFLHTLPFLPADPQVWMTMENLAGAARAGRRGVSLPS